ncbi:MAG: hypothetical protein GQ574_26980 [Crocinitomix sp.]|nr:hypothetical protein [Crocinitomix sp.]
MKFRLTSEKINESDLKGFETQYGIKLPKSFKDFYLEHNGGIPSLRYYKDQRIAAFTSIKYGRESGRTGIIMEVHQLGDLLPEGYIPFAFDSGGWNFCINTNDIDYGHIYILPNGVVDNKPIFLSESFESFIGGLKAEDTYE